VTPDQLSFGDFRLDPLSGQLYRGDATVPLAPKAFALLQYMAAQPGRLISKQELLDRVWPGVYVTDAVLKTTVRDLRRALRDDSHTPRYIETAHRRGYRFIAPVTGARGARGASGASGATGVLTASDTAVAAPLATLAPAVRYARSGDVNIAYQVVGSGPRDIVFVMGWVSHLEYFWNEPTFARFLLKLAANARLILFDKRGTGLSDPVPITGLPTLEQRMADVTAVMQAVGSERAVLVGISEGGPLCCLFAATYPQRTEAVVMMGGYARRLKDHDYPWGVSHEERDRFCQRIIDEWGGPVGIEERAPSRANDPAFRDWWSAYLRMGASPGAAVALTRMNAEIDIRAVLPFIRVPTLIIHRTGDRCLRVEEGRLLASRIPGAEFLELPGDDHLPFVGDQDAVLGAIERFLARRRTRQLSEHVLASVLTVCTDTALPAVCDAQVVRLNGYVAERQDRTLIATFDGPGRAIGSASLMIAAAADAGVAARAGVHVGECDPARAEGAVFDASLALARSAVLGAVHVSRTVVDLLPGSGLLFERVEVGDSLAWRVVR
jgi:pimeloyl-ACP methyl ester carboxylesterase/DNA-binding winged helix-turn-helix (wHTH) protein